MGLRMRGKKCQDVGLIETNCQDVALIEGDKAGVGPRGDRAMRGIERELWITGKRDAVGVDRVSRQIQNECHPGRPNLLQNSCRMDFSFLVF